MKHIFLITALTATGLLNGQSYRWQQRVEYTMNINFDADKHQFNGKQFLKLYNNSPDTLTKLFYHLYFNAFQPGSDMDIRSRTIFDPDPRIGKRIAGLSKDEIGYHEIKCIQQGNKNLKYSIHGTILQVELANPINSMDSAILEMDFKSQVPIQIRRSGRDNKEGIDYSMAQWYPKLCNYDEQGWHTPPYVAREFYGPWGRFDVTIQMDSKYCIGATGLLQNQENMGCGYSSSELKGKSKSWHFIAENVHDFVWAADRDYTHRIYTRSNNCKLHFIYQENDKTRESWAALPAIIDSALIFIEANFGPYAYSSYSFIQGGDGGMEYPMATLITGNRPLISLVGVSIHELMHSWYQMMLATNESLYPWMDEGFASFAEEEVINHLKKLNLIPGAPNPDPHQETIQNYITFINTGREENLSTHADHYNTNTAYGQESYGKGALCLVELKYIMGERPFRKGMLNYYWKWRFRHPNPNDFFREMEKVSGIELDWFKEYFVYSTKKMDYAIDSIYQNGSKTICRIKRIGLFPMPIEIKVYSKSSEPILYYIPLNLMLGSKDFNNILNVVGLKEWSWVNPYYEFEIEKSLEEIKSIQLDPENQLLDVNPNNNLFINNLN